jgi:hypothetical protein
MSIREAAEKFALFSVTTWPEMRMHRTRAFRKYARAARIKYGVAMLRGIEANILLSLGQSMPMKL